jgi:hypothetical protein
MRDKARKLLAAASSPGFSPLGPFFRFAMIAAARLGNPRYAPAR